MVLLASEFDKSRFLKAADLDKEKKFRISKVTAEVLGQGDDKERKPIVWFTNDERGLVLNKTNLRALQGAFGDNMETWVGKVIIVFPTQTDFGGKMVGALRVRIPPPKQAVAGNGQPTKIVQQEVLPPEPKPPLKDDLDDEIGF